MFGWRMQVGDTFVVDLPITDNGTPVDLTGKTLRITIKRSSTDTDEEAVFRGSTSDGVLAAVAPATAGILRVHLPPSATSALVAPLYLVWDIKLYDASDRYTVAEGVLVVEPTVTRAAS